MSDWGKFILAFLQGNPSKIFALTVAIILFVPCESFSEIRNAYPTMLAIFGAISLAIVILGLYEWFVSWKLKKKGEEKEEEERRRIKEIEDLEWEEFLRLTPAMQFFILDLYFSPNQVVYVQTTQSAILTLFVSRYITNVGGVSIDNRFRRVGDVALTAVKRAYIRKYINKCKKRWEELNKEEIKKEIRDWMGIKSCID